MLQIKATLYATVLAFGLFGTHAAFAGGSGDSVDNEDSSYNNPGNDSPPEVENEPDGEDGEHSVDNEPGNNPPLSNPPPQHSEKRNGGSGDSYPQDGRTIVVCVVNRHVFYARHIRDCLHGHKH